jgi:death-on-curing protein
MKHQVRFLTVDEVVQEQLRQLELYGFGEPGILNQGALEAAVMSPQASFGGEFLFDGVHQMASAYLVRLAKAHAFGNANKRTALSSMLIFLAVNGYTIADARDEHLVELALDAATGGGDIRLPMQFLQVYCQRARRLSWDEASDVMHRRFGNVFAVLADK